MRAAPLARPRALARWRAEFFLKVRLHLFNWCHRAPILIATPCCASRSCNSARVDPAGLRSRRAAPVPFPPAGTGDGRRSEDWCALPSLAPGLAPDKPKCGSPRSAAQSPSDDPRDPGLATRAPANPANRLALAPPLYQQEVLSHEMYIRKSKTLTTPLVKASPEKRTIFSGKKSTRGRHAFGPIAIQISCGFSVGPFGAMTANSRFKAFCTGK